MERVLLRIDSGSEEINFLEFFCKLHPFGFNYFSIGNQLNIYYNPDVKAGKTPKNDLWQHINIACLKNKKTIVSFVVQNLCFDQFNYLSIILRYKGYTIKESYAELGKAAIIIEDVFDANIEDIMEIICFAIR